MLSPNAKAFMIDNLLNSNSKRRQREEDDVNDDVKCNINGCHISHVPCLICKDSYSDKYIHIELYQQELWSAFHRMGTEMIITRNGRRMFPCIRIKISRVDPSSLYKIYMNFKTTDGNRYRYIYQRSRWITAGVSEGRPTNKSCNQVQVVRGKHLLNQPISFEKLKLTNTSTDNCGKVCLRSMQRYLPQITVLRISETHPKEHILEKYQFSFPQTSFVAVTAYQNQNITQLKISENPFAKGFRRNRRDQ